MNHQIRKNSDYLLRLLTILAMVWMTACSTATSPSKTQAGSPPAVSSATAPRPNPSDTPSNATPDVNAGNVTITFAALYYDDWTDYQALANAFHQQNPTITVIIIPVDHAIQLANADIAKQADVIYLNGYNPGVLPGFLSLQPLVDATTGFKVDAFWPGSTTACSDAQGNLYGLPLTMNLEGIYYDPIIFDQAHVAYPQPGWTWSQFQQTITQVAGTANGVNVYGFLEGVGDYILFPFLEKALMANDGKLDPQVLSASLNWYVQLAKEKKLYPVQPPDRPDGGRIPSNLTPLVTGGQAAMWTFSTAFAYNAPLIQGSVYVPYPIDPADDHTTPASPSCGAISSGTKNPQAAWAWLDFLSQQDLTGGGSNPNMPVYLPGRSSLVKASAYWAGLTDEQKSAMTYGLEHAWYYPSGLGDTPSYVLQAIASAIQSGTDLATALQGVVASTGSSTLPTSTTEPVMVNTLQATLPPEVQTISFNASYWTGSVDPATALKPQIAAFEKTHPEIKVKLVTGFSIPDDGNAFRKLATDYDCFEFPSPDQFLQSISDNDLLDLTSFMDANISVKDDFYSAFLKPFQKDGKLYGLPTGTTIQYIAYNEDLLTKLGLPFPASGWTFEEMMALAAKAANPSASTPTYGLGATPDSLLAAAGVHWYDSTVQPPHALFNSDEVAKGLAWLTQLYKKGTLYWLADYMNYNKAILNGQVALWVISGFETYDSYGNGNITVQNLPFKVGYAPGPTLSSGAVFSYPPVSFGFYISSHTKYPQACWNWIQYLSDQPSVFGGYTPRKTILEKEAVGLNPDQFAAIRASIEQYQNSNYVYIDQLNPLIGPYTTKRIQVEIAVLQAEDIATVLADAQRNADAYMSCISQKNLTGLDTLQISKLVQSCNDSTKITP